MVRHSSSDRSGSAQAVGVSVVAVACIGLIFVGLRNAAASDFRVPAGRFEFAPVPEHAFVAGLPETVQLGIWQLDPTNPWPAGDQTRSTGWSSRFPTRLVDASSGKPVPGIEYDGKTGSCATPATVRATSRFGWSGPMHRSPAIRSASAC